MERTGADKDVDRYPAREFELVTTIRRVSADGEITAEQSLTDLRFIRAEMAEGRFRKYLERLKRVSTILSMSNRGELLSFAAADGTPQGFEEEQEVLARDSLVRTALLALPGEEVGVGARWRFESGTDYVGFPIQVSQEVTLVGFEGDQLRLRSRLTRSIPEPLVREGTVPVTLASYTGTETTDVLVDLSLTLPAAWTHSFASSARQVFSGDSPGTIEQEFSGRIEMRSRR